jgi:starch-binding outer membrane protein, SusD/RagB family
MNKNYFNILFLVSVLVLSGAGCKKQDEWLDKKRDKTDVTPETLKHLRAVMDNTTYLNTAYPMLGLTGTDNVWVPDANIGAATEPEQNAYKWNKEIYPGAAATEYSAPYQRVAYANIVLEGLRKITPTPETQEEYNSIKGNALFIRSLAYYTLMQLFCKPYSMATAGADPGIVLRDKSDANEIYPRSSVKQGYDQIISDLESSIDLLPLLPLYKTRASRIAVKGLLAKVYLSMDDYANAFAYADQALTAYDALLNFNNTTIVNPASTYRFPVITSSAGTSNPEIIFYAEGATYVTLVASIGNQYVDSLLYKSYHINDMRRSIFYKDNGGNKVQFVGSYTGNYPNFCGIATNELYLIRAECLARQGNASSSMENLSLLLKNRWKTNTFTPISANDPAEALGIILTERRKELPFTSQVRWEDLRRLNKDPRFAITIRHIINGTVYSILPNDKRYVFPIPNNEILLAGIEQNER